MNRKLLIALILVSLTGTVLWTWFSLSWQKIDYRVCETAGELVVLHTKDEAWVVYDHGRGWVSGPRSEMAMANLVPRSRAPQYLGHELNVIHLLGEKKTKRTVAGLGQGSPLIFEGALLWRLPGDPSRWWRWSESGFNEVEEDEALAIAGKIRSAEEQARREGWELIRTKYEAVSEKIPLPLATRPQRVEWTAESAPNGRRYLRVLLRSESGPEEVLLDQKATFRPATEAEIWQIKMTQLRP